jgi:hypothetical protein
MLVEAQTAVFFRVEVEEEERRRVAEERGAGRPPCLSRPGRR